MLWLWDMGTCNYCGHLQYICWVEGEQKDRTTSHSGLIKLIIGDYFTFRVCILSIPDGLVKALVPPQPVRLSCSNAICAFLWALASEIRALCEHTGSKATPLLVYCAEHAAKEECSALETCTCSGWANLCVSKWLGSGCWGGFGSDKSSVSLPGLGEKGSFFPPLFFDSQLCKSKTKRMFYSLLPLYCFSVRISH